MIFQKTIHQNFINILISQYEKPSKPFFGNPKRHWIAQFFPSKPLNIHHLGWSGFPGLSQKLHLQDHPIRLRQWQLRTLCLFRSSQNLGFGQGVPPTEWSECLLYIYIYIYLYVIIIYIYITKETVFERISHNKQVLDGLGDAAAHASTNWMTLYFSQDLRSADQFSEAKQTQPVHLQHHPACHSSML